METIKIDIAAAHSRLAKTWKNRTVDWEELVRKCSKPVRTGETVREYLRMSREEQSRIKDVGGFVAAYLNGGTRKTASVLTRSAVTLDLDFATPGTWEDFSQECGNAALVYSTHKHTPEKPRLRIILPASRAMTPTEYEPVARYWAGRVGIEQVDHTTYQLARLFYWPSVSKDGDFFFGRIDGPAFDVDEVLATYRDYHDASSWPVSSREGDAVAHEIRKAGDPTEKSGVIGAFCRAYTIEEAIEVFLSEKYEATAHDGRYTYRSGSVAGGLVCYEHKFAYSHHETDPSSMKLCNAFDLVRIHLFGLRDEGSRVTDNTRLPSYTAMVEYAAKDRRVCGMLARERLADAAADFEGVEVEEPPAGEDNEKWLGELERDKNGGIRSSAKNIMLILENDPGLKGKLWHDLFSGFDMVRGGLPWDKTATQWGARDDANLRIYVERRYGITGKDKIKDAKDAVLTKNKVHPIRDYLMGLKWDGVRRLETLVIDYLGAEDSRLTRAMTRKHFTAAVARVMNPGCKYDYCLILAGPEGLGKSTLLSIMGGEWFNDSLSLQDGKAGMEQLRCCWIGELAELAGMKRSEVEAVKAYISRQDDIYRGAYQSVVERHPRQCIFCGTTNEALFLKGDTGNRRFWVIEIKPDLRRYDNMPEALGAVRDQLWAEAVALWKAGEKLYLPDDLEAEARQRQKQFNDDNDDPLRGMLEVFLETPIPVDWPSRDAMARRSYYLTPDELQAKGTELRGRVCAAEFICERLGRDMRDKEYRYLARKVTAMLQDLGWGGPITSRHVETLYGRQKSFTRPEKENNEDAI